MSSRAVSVVPAKRQKSSRPGPPHARTRSSRGNVAIADCTPTVYIDDRAGSKELVKYPPLDRCGELCRLSSGDVLINGHGPSGAVVVGIEVKSVFDLISSMDTGRAQETQIRTMLTEFDEVWLLYYGLYRPSPVDGSLEVWRGAKGHRKSGWRPHVIGTRTVPYGYLEKFLLTASAVGVRVKRVTDAREAACWIGAAARWWAKEWSKHKSFRVFDRSRRIVGAPVDREMLEDVDESTLLKARLAKEIPGLGYERAMAAARHFATVEDMVSAGVSEWCEVPGIGRTIARSILDAAWWRRERVKRYAALAL